MLLHGIRGQRASVVIRTLILGEDYTEGELVGYTHISGDVSPVSAYYQLRAKADFVNYTDFNVFDWTIVTNNTWAQNVSVLNSNKYDIFPNDTIRISTDGSIFVNHYSGIVTSEALVFEASLIYAKQVCTLSSTVQVKTTTPTLIYAEAPTNFDDSKFGIVDNGTFNGLAIFNVGFDNWPDDFDLYFKFKITGDPTVRTIYPEVTSYCSITWNMNASQLALIDVTDYTEFNYQGFPIDRPPFVSTDDFFYFRFYKTPLMDKVEYTRYDLNEIPPTLS